jgi:hypothetical protein
MAWVWPTFPFRSVLSVLTCPGLPWISGELCRVSAVSFCFSDHQITRCPDHPILPSPLPRSSQIGADFKGYHPNPSQIGVGFSDFPTIGAGFSGGAWVWFFRYLPVAICLFSKTVQRTTFSLWSEFTTLPFCSPSCQEKSPFLDGNPTAQRAIYARELRLP